MNRIILIGNGFDLAHKMETSYKNFIDDFWSKKIDKFNGIGFIRNKHKPTDDEDILISILNDSVLSFDNLRENKTYGAFSKKVSEIKGKLKFINKILEVISKDLSLKDWVDIEGEYYDLLKHISLSQESTNSETTRYKNLFLKDDYSIKDLNKDFALIKNYLKSYLTTTQEKLDISSHSDIYEAITNHIDSSFHLNDFTVNSKKILEDNMRKNLLKRTEDDIPDNILFVNFNYTNTDKYYTGKEYFKTAQKTVNIESIHIHGELNNPDNPMIFGYGDEMCDKYRIIENLNDNEYLENIKSIRYLDTDNYKRILKFIDSELYQIFIFGHSCGNSDRTLLNTLFENKNCVSIKPFYWKYENGDNYSDIVRNISRDFNDKAVMRDKVVNKKYCSPLVP